MGRYYPSVRNEAVSVPLRGALYLSFPRRYGGKWRAARADGGTCALRALLSLWMVYGLRSWRPLRHTACATSPALAGEAGGTLRPLAGFWFLNVGVGKWHHEAESWHFRPLAGALYLSFPRRYGGSGEQCEPMGDGASTHNIRPLSSAPRITPPSAISCIARRIPSHTLRKSFRTCALVNRRTRSCLACIYAVRFMS